MIVDQQLHGYRNGHELLSGTIRLPVRDQDLIDRLSDIAGPIGPSEKFAPYLTCYPLPSGTHYVMARTWQDHTAPRAGCVRTRSLIVTMADWVDLLAPASLAQAATEAGPNIPGRQLMVEPMLSVPLPPVEGPGVELLEALFLEESVPVVVFGAAAPELLALRFLSAIWPSMRRGFTLSTFCNSPRTIAKRSFDLVFAPVSARSRFSDWKGRRVDGTRQTHSRHHWSAKIENEVLRSPNPSLAGFDVFGEMAGDKQGSRESLRLSLLWHDLATKIEAEPHAALGLLDIANTRPARRAELVELLAPALAEAAKSAALRMSPADAWRFLQVLIGKLGATRWQLSLARSIRSTTTLLAKRAPTDAVAAIPRLLHENGGDFLIAGLANGLADVNPFVPVAVELSCLAPSDLLRVMLTASDLTRVAFQQSTGLDASLAVAVEQASSADRGEAKQRFMQHVLSNRHAEIFRALLSDATADTVISEGRRLAGASAFREEALNQVLADAARRTAAARSIRDIILSTPQSDAVYRMLKALLEPDPLDVDWVVTAFPVSDPRRSSLLFDVLVGASNDQLRAIVGQQGMLAKILLTLGTAQKEAELLARIAENVHLSVGDLISLVLRVLPSIPARQGHALAARGLDKALGQALGADRDKIVASLIGFSGPSLDPANAMRTGLSSSVTADIASRNLILFDSASPEVRGSFVGLPEVLAETIMARHVLDLSYLAAEAVGRLLWDSARVNNRGYARASAMLLHFLMHQRDASASPIIAAAFPSVYRELQQDKIPDFLSFVFIFMDWDRCKIARRELADALLSSQWRPRDIALAAARAGDPERILRNIIRKSGGRSVLTSIEREIGSIPEPWQSQVRKALRDIGKGDGISTKLNFDT